MRHRVDDLKSNIQVLSALARPGTNASSGGVFLTGWRDPARVPQK
jgi:hypothetical protein